MFALQNFREGNESKMDIEPGELKFTVKSFDKGTSRFDLFLSGAELQDTIHMVLEYSSALFKTSSAQQIVSNYLEILNQVLENKDIKLRDITISSNLVHIKSTVDQKEYMNFGF
jgi:hypothetical protein